MIPCAWKECPRFPLFPHETEVGLLCDNCYSLYLDELREARKAEEEKKKHDHDGT